MQSAPVAVDPASQHKCRPGSRERLEDWRAGHLCPECGAPLPISDEEDYFSVFGVPRRFGQDRAELEKRFYELSRLLHPDRFTTTDLESKARSLARMSFVNQAYAALKNPAELRAYLLRCEGLNLKSLDSSKRQIPIDLAESWFEIQDLLMDDPIEAREKLVKFERHLASFEDQVLARLSQLEKDYDAQPSRQTLEEISKGIEEQSYLKSMKKDVERIKKNGVGSKGRE